MSTEEDWPSQAFRDKTFKYLETELRKRDLGLRLIVAMYPPEFEDFVFKKSSTKEQYLTTIHNCIKKPDQIIHCQPSEDEGNVDNGSKDNKQNVDSLPAEEGQGTFDELHKLEEQYKAGDKDLVEGMPEYPSQEYRNMIVQRLTVEVNRNVNCMPELPCPDNAKGIEHYLFWETNSYHAYVERLMAILRLFYNKRTDFGYLNTDERYDGFDYAVKLIMENKHKQAAAGEGQGEKDKKMKAPKGQLKTKK
ncbi:hypothetical protein L596_009956 [Steinernema carpocapsae]|uniref:Mediator of RNA polymerase II transcription subunit 15 n=1 Tax=Steinernema carpocapsae TaxID=34508 RepID=A0A4U5PHN5_STECR|nr:hypothetical protein L596_009956 [Steinernema carpocapsae]